MLLLPLAFLSALWGSDSVEGITQEIQEYASQLQFEYPFILQANVGCELYSGATLKSFFQVAYQGSDFLSLQNMSWVPAPEGENKARRICDTINQYDGIKETVHKLIRSICPQFTWGLLDAGKKYFQRQERPDAWLSSHSIYGSSLQLLVCHVSGFYPKPIWVMWMRGEQEQLNTQQGDILPNADGTWYLRVTLDVEARDAVGLACWVRHSSLGGQDLILPWGHHPSMKLVLLAVLVALMLPIALALWFKKRWRRQWLSLENPALTL